MTRTYFINGDVKIIMLTEEELKSLKAVEDQLTTELRDINLEAFSVGDVIYLESVVDSYMPVNLLVINIKDSYIVCKPLNV